MHTRPKVNVKNAIHVLREFIFPPSEWSDDRTSGGQRLAHCLNRVKQIIIKSMGKRKIYVTRRVEDASTRNSVNHRHDYVPCVEDMPAAGDSLRRCPVFLINRSLHLTNAILLFFAAAIAGTLNAVAGGGSLVSLPIPPFTRLAGLRSQGTNNLAPLAWIAGRANCVS